MREALGALVPRYRVVAIVTGRPSAQTEPLVGVPGVRVLGLYGLEGTAPALPPEAISRARAAAGAVPEAWAEDKGASVAVHYRQAPDPSAARSRLAEVLGPVAADLGLELVEGKMVLELVPADRPKKGGAVERLAHELGLSAVLYAGDDRADVEAFEALDRLAARGVAVVRVAVRGAETPSELLDAADLVVEGPPGLVGLLGSLAS